MTPKTVSGRALDAAVTRATGTDGVLAGMVRGAIVDVEDEARGQFPLGRDWMVKTMTDNARLGSPRPTLVDLVADVRDAWEDHETIGSRDIDEAIEALERYAEANP